MPSGTQSRCQQDRGTAAVEFALVLLPLMLCVFGIIDFGRAFHAQMRLTEAARQGVRTVVLTPADQDPADNAGLLITEALGVLATDAAEPIIEICEGGADQASVVITYDFQSALMDRQLVGQAVMQCPS